MAFERIKELASSLTNDTSSVVHPFDPLSRAEIEQAVSIIRDDKGDQFYFNAVTLHEPRKAEMSAWLKSKQKSSVNDAENTNGTNGVNGHDGHKDRADKTGVHKSIRQPNRVADVVAIGKGSKVFDGLVDLAEGKLLKWKLTEGVQPLVSPKGPPAA